MAVSRGSAERGAAIYEYRPLPADPMLIAALIVVGLSTFLLAPIALYALPGPSGSELYPLGGLCFVPFAILTVTLLLLRPSLFIVHEHGLTRSIPAIARLVGVRDFYDFDDIVNLYPAHYEIAGAVLSPFASSAGTIRHMGIVAETAEGEVFVMKFTPGRLDFSKGRSRGFRWALEAIEAVYVRRGEAMVGDTQEHSVEELRTMGELATRPLLNIGHIFAAFLTPAIIVGAFLWGSTRLGIEGGWSVSVALVLAALPPLAVYGWTYKRARRRSWAIRELAKRRYLALAEH